MATKKSGAKKVQTAQPATRKLDKAVRLDLSTADHARLERAAESAGLNMASFARMALFKELKRHEGESGNG